MRLLDICRSNAKRMNSWWKRYRKRKTIAFETQSMKFWSFQVLVTVHFDVMLRHFSPLLRNAQSLRKLKVRESRQRAESFGILACGAMQLRSHCLPGDWLFRKFRRNFKKRIDLHARVTSLSFLQSCRRLVAPISGSDAKLSTSRAITRDRNTIIIMGEALEKISRFEFDGDTFPKHFPRIVKMQSWFYCIYVMIALG